MQAKLLRIKLKPNCETLVDNLIVKMKRDLHFVADEMRQKGYFWDSVFMGKVGNDTYLYIVGKSTDWSKTLKDVAMPTPFRKYYEEFRKAAWDTNDILDETWCLNSEFRMIET